MWRCNTRRLNTKSDQVSQKLTYLLRIRLQQNTLKLLTLLVYVIVYCSPLHGSHLIWLSVLITTFLSNLIKNLWGKGQVGTAACGFLPSDLQNEY